MEKPGNLVKIRRQSEVCDSHPNVFATWYLVGETDSFGSEYHYLCDCCKEAHISIKQQLEENLPDDTEVYCELGKHDFKLFGYEDGKRVRLMASVRDPSEGNTGRLYNGCRQCAKQLVQDFLN